MKAIYSFPTMLLTSVMILTIMMLSACTPQPPRPAPGKYETTKTSTDKYGTVRKTDNTTNIYYDKNGKMRGSVEQKTTTDPDGLFNKSTTTTRKTIE